MKVMHNGGISLVIMREGNRVRITPGVNVLPEYGWLDAVINKNAELEYILDVELTDTGVVAEKSKVTNLEKKTVKVESTPKKRKPRKKKVDNTDD